MVEIRIHGRGGQGGVTLAKLIATARFLEGDSVQSFGLYAAERSGAPVQAFCRYAAEPVTDRNLIYEPDHVVVLDPTLVGPGILEGLKPGGWILLNTADPPSAHRAAFPSHRVATVDATAIAREHGLGTRSVPIVNTALLGAVGPLLGLSLPQVEAALDHLGFGDGNVGAARDAFRSVATDEGSPPGWRSAETEDAPGPGRRMEVEPPGASVLERGRAAPPAIRTGSWASEQPRRQQWVPPCNHVCPAGNDVQGFLHALAEGETDRALAVLLETTPFPAVCGRVCPAPCMESCNRIRLDGAVNVRDLERWAGDHGAATVGPRAERTESVAVVGSGPAGLTAAYHLARLGYVVTVLEAGPAVGGLLRTGIPTFRLPEEVLERELQRIRDLGVAFVTRHPVDRAGLVEAASRHDAVLVATGLQELRELGPGLGAAPGVEQGLSFLEEVRQGAVRVDGEDVLVVGGGNTAMDAARSALRLGARSVRVLYRRGRREMPAIREEVDEALEEGVELRVLAQPVSAEPLGRPSPGSGAAGNGAGPAGSPGLRVRCVEMALGEPDASGRRRPEPVEGSEFELECHRLFLALGQSADLGLFPEGTEVREGERLLGVLETPVLAVGDLATGEGTVAAAIGSGRRAAFRLHRELSGEEVEAEGPARSRRDDVDDWRTEVATADDLRLHLFDRAPSDAGHSRPPASRIRGFQEVHTGLDEPTEARRCLSCGVCNDCDLCVTYCPEGVLRRSGPTLLFDYDYCKGCGVCAAECPRGVVTMTHL